MNLSLPPYTWYENAAGERWQPPGAEQGIVDPAAAVPPAGFIYQAARYPNLVVGNLYRLNDATGKPGRLLATQSATWAPDLVLRMATTVTHGPAAARHGAPAVMPLTHAILVASVACDRCLNALAWAYGLVDGDGRHAGFPETGDEYTSSGARCELCDDARRTRPGVIVPGAPAERVALVDANGAAADKRTLQ